MIKVTSIVTPYDENMDNLEESYDLSVAESENAGMIRICFKGEEITVSAKDLLTAIENAQNINRHG